MEPPPVTIAVVSWNTRDMLSRCLTSMAMDVRAGRAEVWVIDNDSSDGSAELVAEHFGWARLIRAGANLGFGAAVNRIASESSGEWLAPANADIELRPGALPALLNAGGRDPSCAIVAPRLVLPDGQTQHSVNAFPTLAVTAAFNLGLGRLFPPLGERLCLPGGWDPDRARTVGWAVGAFLLVRRRAFEALGGFDPDQWMYAEDLDLGWRAAQNGWTTRYEPSASVIHHESTAATHAWGDEQARRKLEAFYAWHLRRRGLVRTRTVAAVSVTGARLRWAILVLIKRVAPARLPRDPGHYSQWASLHRIGFRRAPAGEQRP